MAIRNTQPDDETVTDNIDDRTRRALETPMSVTSPDGTTVDRGETMVLVTSGSSGSGYMVDVTGGRCECKDHRNRRVECKHIRRARIEMGVTPVSTATLAAVDPDSKLGVNTPGPRIDTSEGELMADGGRLFTESTERYEAVECRHGDGEHLVDGYALGEPKPLACQFCDARVYLTSEKTPGVWALNHEPYCPNVN